MSEILKLIGISSAVSLMVVSCALWLFRKWIEGKLTKEFRQFETKQEKILHAHQIKYSDQFKERKAAIDLMVEGMRKFSTSTIELVQAASDPHHVFTGTSYFHWVRDTWAQKNVSFPESCDEPMRLLISSMEAINNDALSIPRGTNFAQTRLDAIPAIRIRHDAHLLPAMKTVQAIFRALLAAEDPV